MNKQTYNELKTLYNEYKQNEQEGGVKVYGDPRVRLYSQFGNNNLLFVIIYKTISRQPLKKKTDTHIMHIYADMRLSNKPVTHTMSKRPNIQSSQNYTTIVPAYTTIVPTYTTIVPTYTTIVPNTHKYMENTTKHMTIENTTIENITIDNEPLNSDCIFELKGYAEKYMEIKIITNKKEDIYKINETFGIFIKEVIYPHFVIIKDNVRSILYDVKPYFVDYMITQLEQLADFYIEQHNLNSENYEHKLSTILDKIMSDLNNVEDKHKETLIEYVVITILKKILPDNAGSKFYNTISYNLDIRATLTVITDKQTMINYVLLIGELYFNELLKSK